MCQFTYTPTVRKQVYIRVPGVTSATVIYVDKVNFYAKGKDSLNNPQSTVSTTHLPLHMYSLLTSLVVLHWQLFNFSYVSILSPHLTHELWLLSKCLLGKGFCGYQIQVRWRKARASLGLATIPAFYWPDSWMCQWHITSPSLSLLICKLDGIHVQQCYEKLIKRTGLSGASCWAQGRHWKSKLNCYKLFWWTDSRQDCKGPPRY